MKVLLATGVEVLDKRIIKHVAEKPELGIDIVGEIYYREAINTIAEKIDVAIVSEEIPSDNQEFVNGFIYQLRRQGIRVVMLPGDPDSAEAQELVDRCTPMGVYDYVYNNVTIEGIINKMLNPSTIAQTRVRQEALQAKLNAPQIEVTEYPEAVDPEHTTEVESKSGLIGKIFGNIKSKKPREEDDEKEAKILDKFNIGGISRKSTRDMSKESPFKINIPRTILSKKDTVSKSFNLAVIAPWMNGIGATFLCNKLSEVLGLNIIDCDLAGRGAGVRLGINPVNLWEFDWRGDGQPVEFDDQRKAWLLDPYKTNDDISLKETLKDVIKRARNYGSFIIDAGSNPNAWYAQEAIDASDVVCIAVSGDQLHVARALPKWKAEMAIRKPAVIALLGGEASSHTIQDIFNMKCIKVNGGKTDAGIAELIAEFKMLASSDDSHEHLINVCAVGLMETPKMPGVIINHYPETFSMWKNLDKNNMPDALIFAPGPGIKEFIHDLRNNEYFFPIAIIGDTNEEYYMAGVDACYQEVSFTNIKDLISRKSHVEKIVEKSNVDELTGCYRRDALEQVVNAELQKYHEKGTPFSIMMCDLDHFKKVNDTYGHDAGDIVLKEFGEFLRYNMRNTDKVIRYGGEEFVAVFGGCDANTAYTIAEKLRNQWANKTIKINTDNNITSTFSGGVAQCGRNGKDLKTLLKSADQALYQAKEMSRNKVNVA